MIGVIFAVSLILAVIADTRRTSGSLRLTKIQTDCLFMIMMLSLIGMINSVALSLQ